MDFNFNRLTERGISQVRNIVPEKSDKNSDRTSAENIRDNNDQSIDSVQKSKLLLLQVDGLSCKALQEAVEDGYAPNLSGMLESGEYSLTPYFCGLPSVTKPIQAAMFYGQELPGNVWFDKTEDKVVSAEEFEYRHLQNNNELMENGLMNNGLVLCSPLSGGADDTVSATSNILQNIEDKGMIRTAVNEASKHVNLLRNDNHELTGAGVNFVKDMVNFRREMQKVDGYNTKSDRVSLLLLAADKNFLEDTAVSGIKDGIDKGLPVIYTDFLVYDEFLHYLGPEAEQSRDSLRVIDENIGKIMEKAENSKDDYNVIIFSDHGQTRTSTFQEAYGKSVLEQIKEYAGEASEKTGEKFEESDIVFSDVASLGNVYFRFSEDKLDISDIENKYSGLCDKLVKHPGISMVCGKQNDRFIILGKQGTIDVDSDDTYAIKGANPLEQYGENTDLLVKNIKNYIDRENTGDLIIIGNYDQEKDEAVNFSTKYTFNYSHGGLGGQQNEPFIIAKSGLDIKGKNITEPGQLGEMFRDILDSQAE
jgi:hypothetical protein